MVVGGGREVGEGGFGVGRKEIGVVRGYMVYMVCVVVGFGG